MNLEGRISPEVDHQFSKFQSWVKDYLLLLPQNQFSKLFQSKIEKFGNFSSIIFFSKISTKMGLRNETSTFFAHTCPRCDYFSWKIQCFCQPYELGSTSSIHSHDCQRIFKIGEIGLFFGFFAITVSCFSAVAFPVFRIDRKNS